MKINYNKHIWEGWTVQSFVDDLQSIFNIIQSRQSWQKKFENSPEDLERLKQWCMDNQPYYKKHIPEVYNHFKQLLK